MLLIVDGKESRNGPWDWYHLEPNEARAARFAVDTSEIEFRFYAGK
ncbi:MAG: hypothetical protein OEO82_02115 [Gammaproteobacteria bacterium]|nr:hypothetical protein [Gammaproteobacteria bacterium]